MGWNRRLVLAGAVAAASGAALGQPQQQVTGPVAVYWMTTATTTGFSMGGMMGPPAGGGGRGGIPNIAAMMGGGGPSHSLILQLGSTQRPTGAPSAQHLPPPVIKSGGSLPLVTPQAAPSQPVEPPSRDSVPQQYQQPRGRILIFWGCGERAPQGQPVILDFATLTDPAQIQRLGNLLQGINAAPMQPPSPSRFATYGEWPNGQPPLSIPGDSSLVGSHIVRGTYSPQINFALTADQDFMEPLNLTSNDRNPGGWVQLSWNSVPRTLGYFASVMGGSGGAGGQSSDVVLWTSSKVQAAAFTAPDYMTPAETNRLVASGALMSPQTTTCNVYREVVQATQGGLLSLNAYGGETNISFPPRPENPATPWNIQWTLKVRYKSTTGGLLGQPMPGGLGGGIPGRGGQEPPQQTPPPARGPGGLLRGLGGGIPGFPGR